jgi:hypothetical protein
MKDDTGRWSHWSAPVQFTTGTPLAAGVVQNLRLTELMYNPPAPDTAKGELNLDKNEFEFIELKNIGDENLDISSLSITNGVTFNFSGSAVTSLLPGEFVLVVRTPRPSIPAIPLSSRIAGAYSGGGQRRRTNHDLGLLEWCHRRL